MTIEELDELARLLHKFEAEVGISLEASANSAPDDGSARARRVQGESKLKMVHFVKNWAIAVKVAKSRKGEADT